MSGSTNEDRAANTIRLVPQNERRPLKISGKPPPPAEARERDSYAVTALGDVIDRSTHAALARYTLGLSPAALAHCYMDWITHLIASPGKQMQLVQKAIRKSARLFHHVGDCACGKATQPCIQPLPQ